MKVYRTHDNFYLKTNLYKKPKKIHEFAYNLIKKTYIKNNTIVDFGCAAGEFAYFLKKKIKTKIYGCDNHDSLLKKARKKVKNIFFFKKDISKYSHKNISDISVCVGVIQIFDDFAKIISSLIYSTKKSKRKMGGGVTGRNRENKGGVIILHFLSNNYDLDVLVKYSNSVIMNKVPARYSGKTNGDIKKKYFYKKRIFQNGWNILSKSTIASYLKENHHVKSFYFKDFLIKNTIKKNKKDFVRSWTINIDKQKKTINGIGIVQNHCFVVIKLY
jgi:SAM-dependent methyltransferase